MVKRSAFIVLLSLVALITKAQVSCFVQTKLDRNSVYAQQPFKVTITVLTATWYTAPLEFDNLQIPNAFILPFDRTQPGMFDINKKQYAGLQFYFIVFPYKPGHFTLPAINIVATTPAVGDYKGKKVNVKSQPLSYVVKPVPKNFTADYWFVAKNVSITQTWNKPLRNLKIGDVLEATLTIDAKGTLPQFIPDLKTDSLDWAGVYPEQATLADTRDEYDANGTRTQSVTYLLEKEGDFTFPAPTIEWLNPNNSRVYKRSAPAVKIHVSANPNLGILKTLKDSLSAKQPVKATANVKHGPYLIYGIPWYYFALYAIAALWLLSFIIRLIIRAVRVVNRKYQSYLLSERYWFRKFSSSSSSAHVLLKNLYAWWDRFPVRDKVSSIQSDAKDKGATDIDADLASYYRKLYADGSDNVNTTAEFKKNVEKYRRQLMEKARLKENKNIAANQTLWEE
jgi:hypothetical protein